MNPSITTRRFAAGRAGRPPACASGKALLGWLVWTLLLGACLAGDGARPKRGQVEKIAVTYANVQDVVDALHAAGVPCELVGPAASSSGQCHLAPSTVTIQVMPVGEQLPQQVPADEMTYWATGPNWVTYTTDGRTGQPVREALGNYRRGALPPPGPTCHEAPATIVGTNGADVVQGTPGGDVIVAGDGNDDIRSYTGRDGVCAGSGDDTISLADGDP